MALPLNLRDREFQSYGIGSDGLAVVKTTPVYTLYNTTVLNNVQANTTSSVIDTNPYNDFRVISTITINTDVDSAATLTWQQSYDNSTWTTLNTSTADTDTASTSLVWTATGWYPYMRLVTSAQATSTVISKLIAR